MAARMRSTSPPGSMTTPILLASSHRMAQFCWKGVTGTIAPRRPLIATSLLDPSPATGYPAGTVIARAAKQAPASRRLVRENAPSRHVPQRRLMQFRRLQEAGPVRGPDRDTLG